MEKQNQESLLNAVTILHGERCEGSGCCDLSSRDSEFSYDLWVFPRKVQEPNLGYRTGSRLDENELDLRNGTEIVLNEKELESLIDLIGATLAAQDTSLVIRSNTGTEARSKSKQKFRLSQNERNKKLDQYNLHVSRRGMNCVFLVARREFQLFVEEVAHHKLWRAIKWAQLERHDHREAIARLRMKGKTLDEIRGQIRLVNPHLESDRQERLVLDVLLAAAFFVGPNIECLVSFTRAPLNMVADISCRMHDSGFWSKGRANIEQWFDEDLRWNDYGIQQDCGVACGDLVARREGPNDEWTYESSGRPSDTNPFTKIQFAIISSAN
jgi:hypothetical protein